MQLDGLALDEHRLEGLDAQTVQGRRPVQHDRVLGDDLVQDVPHLGELALHQLLGRLDVLHLLALHQAAHDEGLEQLESHGLGDAALMQLELRAGHDDRTARVVHPLAQQVLAEAALLALEHVGERLQGAVARAGDGPAAAAVVEEGVDRFLQHALLVVDDDLRSAQVEQALQAVVAVDDPAIEIVEVGGGETAAVQLHHGAQLRRDDRDRLQDHPLRPVVGAQEALHHLEALDRPGELLALGGLDGLAQRLGLGLEIDGRQAARGWPRRPCRPGSTRRSRRGCRTSPSSPGRGSHR